MPTVIWVALGGAIGSVMRHGVNVASARSFGSAFPWGTFTVNVLGSFAIGVLAAVLMRRMPGATDLKFFLTTGLLGGFTTFSAFSLDAAQLIERSSIAAALYVGGTVVLSILAVLIGLALGRGLGA
jgi:fluoride exporter